MINKIKKSGVAFVGDDQDGVCYPVNSAEAQFVSPLDRVSLPSEIIADAWGRPAFKNVKPRDSGK